MKYIIATHIWATSDVSLPRTQIRGYTDVVDRSHDFFGVSGGRIPYRGSVDPVGALSAILLCIRSLVNGACHRAAHLWCAYCAFDVHIPCILSCHYLVDRTSDTRLVSEPPMTSSRGHDCRQQTSLPNHASPTRR
jgi:hypothetical protein